MTSRLSPRSIYDRLDRSRIRKVSHAACLLCSVRTAQISGGLDACKRPVSQSAYSQPAPHHAVIEVGDVLVLHDADTGASPKNEVRPCMVVAIASAVVAVAPRSASVKGSVETPVGASTAFTKPGSFSGWRCRVGLAAALAADNHGQLAEPYRNEVLALSRRRK